jgi:hypothetical protein
MKYRKKFIIYSLLAGLTVSINSCKPKKPGLELLAVKKFSSFPSASAIEYNDGKIFLFGDDASYLLILDTGYRQLDTVHYISDTAYRIAKQTKPDIEAATLLQNNNETYLYAIGSFSTVQRRKIFIFHLSNIHSFSILNDSLLFQNLKALPEINTEGLAIVKSKLVLANRANTTHKTNKLVVMNNVFSGKNTSPQATIIDLVLNGKNVIGLSGLHYVEENDILLFTASEENTPSATQDGAIGESYLGCIKGFSKKINQKSVQPDWMINLSNVSEEFKKQKIESVCVEKMANSEAILHLAADNDNGESRLFKMKSRFE